MKTMRRGSGRWVAGGGGGGGRGGAEGMEGWVGGWVGGGTFRQPKNWTYS